MKPTVTLRRMDWGDLEQIVRIEQATFTTPWSYGLFLGELANPASDWFVAADGTEIVGYVGLQEQAGTAHLLNIAVRHDRRRMGLGAELLDKALEAARLRKVGAVTLEVRASNLDAQRFYASHGFTAVGARRAYYSDSGEDAVIMTRVLRHGVER